MKPRFILFRRSGVYYSEDRPTGEQHSVQTKDKGEAERKLKAHNELKNVRGVRTVLGAQRKRSTTMTVMLKAPNHLIKMPNCPKPLAQGGRKRI